MFSTSDLDGYTSTVGFGIFEFLGGKVGSVYYLRIFRFLGFLDFFIFSEISTSLGFSLNCFLLSV